MRVVVQRVQRASATTLEGEPVAEIGPGLVAFTGFGRHDTVEIADRIAGKLANLRIFESEGSKFGRSAIDAGAEVLTVSQLTLYADTSRGRRPNFSRNAATEVARELYRCFTTRLAATGVKRVVAAPFQSRLVVDASNWGPFTVVLDSDST
jgi:D-tyrosyl-tRNA(Tyr) deacylase